MEEGKWGLQIIVISSTLAYASYEISLLCTCIYVISNLYNVMYLDAHKWDYIH